MDVGLLKEELENVEREYGWGIQGFDVQTGALTTAEQQVFHVQVSMAGFDVEVTQS